MARSIYGADGSAQVVSLAGTPTLASATVKSARTGGVTVTDIQTVGGANLGGIVTPDSRGQIIFQGPDNVTDTFWLDFGDGGPRWAVRPVDMAEVLSFILAARDAAQYTAPGGATTRAALPYVPNTAMQKLAEALDTRTTPRFASAGSRDIAFPAPTDGDRCYRTDLHAHQTYQDLGDASRWATDNALIREVVLTADSTSITFASIPQEWRHLELKYRTRITGTAAGNSVHAYFSLRLNNDGSASYAHQGAVRTVKGAVGSTTYEVDRGGGGGGAATLNATYGNQSGGIQNFVGFNSTATTVGFCPGSFFSTTFGGGEITIEDYSTNATRKSIRGSSAFGDNAGGTTTSYMGRADIGGGWSNNAAISRIDLLPTSGSAFVSGSTFRLYGWS